MLLDILAIFLLVHGLFAFINCCKPNSNEVAKYSISKEGKMAMALGNIVVLVTSSVEFYFGLKLLGIHTF